MKETTRDKLLLTGIAVCLLGATGIGGYMFNSSHENGLTIDRTAQEWTEATHIDYDNRIVEFTTYDGHTFEFDYDSTYTRVQCGDSVLVTFDTNHRWNPKWWDIESVDSIEHSYYKFINQ